MSFSAHVFDFERLENRILLANVIVTNTGDEVDGDASSIAALTANPGPTGVSFREAVTAANNTPGADVVRFSIPGDGPHTITIGNYFPNITDTVTIDGYTQAGAKANTLAVGSNAVIKVGLRALGPGSVGLVFYKGSDGSAVRGLSLTGFSGGLDAAAIAVNAADILVEGNWIGLTPGAAPLENFYGVRSGPFCSRLRVGGVGPEGRNVVSGNRVGIMLMFGDQVTVEGNYVGTTPNGLFRASNLVGIDISARFATVGGTGVLRRNIISGNERYGIISRRGDLHEVKGNYVGLAADGSALGNDGIGIMSLDTERLVVGGTEPAEGNRIAYNSGNAVQVSRGTRTTVRLNSIHDNADGGGGVENRFLGIDLIGGAEDGFGVTANDPLDADGGPNELQNFPELTAATTNLDGTTVSGTLRSLPFDDFTIDFYASRTADPSGHGEGEVWLGSIPARTDGTGFVQFSAPVTASGMPYISATSTHRTTGRTSEFSHWVNNLRPLSYNVINNNGSGTGSFAKALELASADDDASLITFSIPLTGTIDITPTVNLAFAKNVIIDATTQGGGGITPSVYITGSGLSLLSLTTNNWVFGLGMFNARGIDLVGGPAFGGDGHNHVVRNWLGVGPQGQAGGIPPFDTRAMVRAFGDHNDVYGNLIYSGRGLPAVWSFGASYNHYERNRIGVNLEGQFLSGNSYGFSFANDSVSGSSDFNTIASNVIANSQQAAFAMVLGNGNSVFANSMSRNGGPGIDLDDDGVTDNDPSDADTGPNGLQNFPVLTSAEKIGGTRITGSLETTSGAFTLHFYSANSTPAADIDEGRVYLGSAIVNTAPTGSASFDVTVPGAADFGQIVLATATAADGSTSEFSTGVGVTDIAPPELTFGDFEFNFGHSYRAEFNEDVSVSLNPGDLTAQRTTGGPIYTPSSVFFDAASNTAVFHFFPMLPDGDYTATLNATGISDAAGNPLTPAKPTAFFVLTGDADHNHRINIDDYNRIDLGYANQLAGFENGDFNLSGTVDFDDYVLIDLAFNTQSGPLAALFATAPVEPPVRPGGNPPTPLPPVGGANDIFKASDEAQDDEPVWLAPDDLLA